MSGNAPASAASRSLLMKIRSIVFPIFNWGQACVIFILILLLTLVAVFSDPLLALHMGVGAYLGIVVTMFLQGQAPEEIEIREDEIGRISDLLATAPHLHPIGNRVWAPARSRSRWFKSDWISISEGEGQRFVLKARRRDLKIILSEIRPRKA